VRNASHLTAGYAPHVARQIELTHPGMAYFSSTGPFGEMCKDCRFYGYRKKVLDKQGNTIRTVFRRHACGRFYELTNKHGPDFPENTDACRYFVRRNDK
jgi:hypothetical protein